MISEFIDKTLKKSNVSKQEKYELKEQFLEHLLSLKEEYLSNGLNEKEAELLAINKFGDTSTISSMFNENKSVRKPIKIASIILLIIHTPFFVLAFNHISRWDVSAARYSFKNLLPFNLIYKVFFKSDFSLSAALASPLSIPFLSHLLLALFFIPIGLLLPIILSKTYASLYNFKMFALIIILLQLSKLVLQIGRPHIDYVIIQLICCMVGFSILELLISIPLIKKNFYE